MNDFDCTKCTHKNVCAYKEQVPKYDDIETDSVFKLTLSCKEYSEMLTLPRLSETVYAPYNRGWTSSTRGNETECLECIMEHERQSNK